MSLARGGYLAQYAYPARLVSFIFSDVIGDDLSSIASGPTVKDDTTTEDAARVLAKYDVLKTCGINGIENCGLVETPKDDKYFARTTNILAVSNVFALNAMRTAAESLGYHAEVRSTTLEGEASDVAKMIAESLHAAPPKTVLLWGGETTVTVHGQGSGGRNITVSAAGLAYTKEGEEILSLASDGHDHGPYAGAICDVITAKAAADANTDIQKHLAESDTYPLFEKIGNYLLTGDTGSNVSDLIIVLKQ
jgi:glycerate-2-kinase